MTTTESALPGGAIFQIPSTLALVADLLETRVADWRKIKERCVAHREIARNRGQFVGTAVKRTTARLSIGDTKGAREIVDEALTRLPSNPDLYCLSGKVFTAASDVGRAEESFHKAFDFGCRKRELFDGWVAVLQRREDWREMARVAAIAEEQLKSCQFQLLRDKALMWLGDQAARSGDFITAEQDYRQALENISGATRKYSFKSDRAHLWQLNETLIVRWLGVVRMVRPPDGSGLKPYLNACLNAILRYRSNNWQIVVTAISSGNEWINRAARRNTTMSLTDDATKMMEKMNRVKKLVNNRMMARGDVPTDLAKQLDETIGRLSKLTAEAS